LTYLKKLNHFIVQYYDIVIDKTTKLFLIINFLMKYTSKVAIEIKTTIIYDQNKKVIHFFKKENLSNLNLNLSLKSSEVLM